jgi:hypothetical protein
MGIKVKKRDGRSGRRRGKAGYPRLFLTSYWGDPNTPCPCPICERFGIKPDGSGGPQVLRIDSAEDFEFVMREMARHSN